MIASSSPILTPDQRLRVFVSSTLQELAPERRAVREAIDSMHLIPVMFELGARPHAPRQLYRQYLAQSHIFLGIYWDRYGWVAPGETVSGLEDEYLLSAGMPRLLYIKESGGQREARLTDLLHRIQADDEVSYKTFRTAEELADLIRNDLAVLLTERFNQAASATVTEHSTPTAYLLPDIPGVLVGREREIEDITGLLEQPDARLITLTGPGGIGKTRLAIETAKRLRHRFTDGVAFIPLAPVRDPALIPETISYALGIKVSDGHTMESLKLFLRNRNFLLVLDNFEQVIEAASIIDDLLLAAPGLQLLVTSRERLSLTIEHVYTVYPLSTSLQDDSPGTLQSHPAAVELFLQRASAVNPAFTLTEKNYDTIVKICRRLEGLPLAIELAAGQIHLFPPALLLQKLNQSLDILHGQYRDIPDRQKTLRNTIAWSYELLTPAEQDLLLEMSLYPAGCLLSAMEFLLPQDVYIFSLLSSLINKSLLTRHEEDDQVRFQMMESVREFALAEIQATDKAAAFRRRQADYYASAIRQARKQRQDGQLARQLQQLEREHPNLRAVLDYLLEIKDLRSITEISWNLWLFWWVNAHTREGYHWLKKTWELYQSGEQTFDEYTLAKLVSNTGTMAFLQRDFETFQYCMVNHRELIFRQEDDELIGTAALITGVVSTIIKDYDAADDMLKISLERFRKIGLTTGISLALSALGRNMIYQGRQFDQAKASFKLSLTIAQREQDDISVIIALSGYALAEAMDRDPQAKAHLREAIRLSRQVHFYEAIAWSMEIWALVSVKEARYEHAITLMGAVDHMRHTTQLPVWEDLQAVIQEARQSVQRQMDPVSFENAWHTGATMSLDEMVAYAQLEETAVSLLEPEPVRDRQRA